MKIYETTYTILYNFSRTTPAGWSKLDGTLLISYHPASFHSFQARVKIYETTYDVLYNFKKKFWLHEQETIPLGLSDDLASILG